MRHSIVIGTNEKEIRLPVAHICLWSNSNISQSSVSYCLHNHIIPITLYVLKDSDEGKDITNWIENEENRNNVSVEKMAMELLLPRMKTEELVEILEIARNQSYEEGYKQAQTDIRKALGMH